MNNFTLYMTTDCNFKCRYCYENYQEQYYLTEEILLKIIDFIMNYENKEKLSLSFLGGEPLLRKDLIYQAVNYIKEHYSDRIVKYYITTNASLIDNQFIKFMKDNEFTIRLSFDGNKSTHELNRVKKDGISCYEKILANINEIEKQKLPYSVRMTIVENTISSMFSNICFLHENNLNNICMIMDVNLKFTKEVYTDFEKQVEMILDYYIQEHMNNNIFSIDQIDGKIFNFLCDFGNCFSMCDAGIQSYKIMPDGNIYPCAFVTNNKEFIIGNISEGINTDRAKELVLLNYDKEDLKCKKCNIRDFCHGMKCGYMNYICTGKVNIPSDAECQCEQIFYIAVEKLIKFYLEQNNLEVEKKLGKFIEFIGKSGLELSTYGKQVERKLRNDAKCKR
ncbi:radical SAM/SPASM domain-containing protein [Lachnotalea glycerini]|nr:radical SAM protein [Lachnotalea glycerini]RDY32037.1 SPASM domain-containing protein [Lachnotalea glycerini]